MEKTKEIKNRDHFLRELLKNEFQRRVEKNPSFSLRAFSLKLEIDQSLLSKLLQGKRSFSNESSKKITDLLGVYINPESSLNSREDLGIEYHLMKEDEFFVLSHWHHFAILELIKAKGFKHSSDYISDKLGVSKPEIERSLERLNRLGFIELKKNKFHLKKPSNSWLNLNETTTARKALQKQVHEKSLQAIEDIPFEKREHSSLTVAIDPKLMPEIKKKITDFRRSLDQYIMDNGNEKEVYNLCVSFFPLTKENDFRF